MSAEKPRAYLMEESYGNMDFPRYLGEHPEVRSGDLVVSMKDGDPATYVAVPAAYSAAVPATHAAVPPAWIGKPCPIPVPSDASKAYQDPIEAYRGIQISKAAIGTVTIGEVFLDPAAHADIRGAALGGKEFAGRMKYDYKIGAILVETAPGNWARADE